MGFGRMSDALARPRPIGGELAVSAMTEDRAASRLDDAALGGALVWVYGVFERTILPTGRTGVGRELFIRSTKIGEIEALVADGGLDDEAAGKIEAAGVVRA